MSADNTLRAIIADKYGERRLNEFESPPFDRWETHLGDRPACWWMQIPEPVVAIWSELSDEARAVAFLIAVRATEE